MKTLNLRAAKAAFSAIVRAAENGEPTVITKDGSPAAMVVPYKRGVAAYPDEQTSFQVLLLTMPHELGPERLQLTVREIDS